MRDDEVGLGIVHRYFVDQEGMGVLELGRDCVGVPAVEDDRDLIAGGQAIVRGIARTGGTVVQVAQIGLEALDLP
jgi:hypothetical protein